MITYTYLKKHIEELKLDNMTSALRHVVSMGILKLIDAIWRINGTLIAVSTNCVIVENNAIVHPLRKSTNQCIRGN